MASTHPAPQTTAEARPECRDAREIGTRPRDSELNWIWLANLRTNMALEVLEHGRDPDPRIEMVFDRVEHHRVEPGRLQIPANDGSADVVFLHDLLPRLSLRASGDRPEPAAIEMLAECRRVLRSGGRVFLTFENAGWYRNLLTRTPRGEQRANSSRPLSLSTVRSWLRRSGFVDERVLFVSTHSGLPATLVPASVPALLAHERMRSASAPRRFVRQALIRLGLAPLLHRRLFVLGRA